MERHPGCSGRRAYECRGGYCGLRFTRAGSVRDIAVVKSQRPVSNPSTSRVTVQSASKPPPPHTVNHGTPEEERDRHPGKNTRVGEPPGDRVGTTERGRGRARAWKNTPVTARQRQRGRLEKNRQDPQRAGGWEGEQAWEGAQGGETGVARRGAGGTRRARVSSEERDEGGTRKKTKLKSDKATKKDKQKGWGRAGKGGSREPTKAQRYTSSRSEKRHADDPH